MLCTLQHKKGLQHKKIIHPIGGEGDSLGGTEQRFKNDEIAISLKKITRPYCQSETPATVMFRAIINKIPRDDIKGQKTRFLTEFVFP